MVCGIVVGKMLDKLGKICSEEVLTIFLGLVLLFPEASRGVCECSQAIVETRWMRPDSEVIFV